MSIKRPAKKVVRAKPSAAALTKKLGARMKSLSQECSELERAAVLVAARAEESLEIANAPPALTSWSERSIVNPDTQDMRPEYNMPYLTAERLHPTSLRVRSQIMQIEAEMKRSTPKPKAPSSLAAVIEAQTPLLPKRPLHGRPPRPPPASTTPKGGSDEAPGKGTTGRASSAAILRLASQDSGRSSASGSSNQPVSRTLSNTSGGGRGGRGVQGGGGREEGGRRSRGEERDGDDDDDVDDDVDEGGDDDDDAGEDVMLDRWSVERGLEQVRARSAARRIRQRQKLVG